MTVWWHNPPPCFLKQVPVWLSWWCTVGRKEVQVRILYLTLVQYTPGHKKHRAMDLVDVLTWTDPVFTGGIFGAGLLFLASNIFISFLSTCAYFTLALTLAGLGSKLYVHLMGFLKKPCSDPLTRIERCDVLIPSEKIEEVINLVIEYLNTGIPIIKSLLLAHNFANSVKFAAVLYSITYIGALCNTLTLIMVLWVSTFILPTFYTTNKDVADQILSQVKTQYKAASSWLLSMVQGKSVKMTKTQ